MTTEQQADEILQNYLDHMMDLLLNHKLRASKPGDEVRIVAQALTRATLVPLSMGAADAEKTGGVFKGVLVQFLYDAGLIAGRGQAIISLSGTDLFQTVILFARNDLHNADLHGAFLTLADLSSGNLADADLRGAILEDANLRGADLTNADLSGADLTQADLGFAKLKGAKVTQEQLNSAKSLQGATMPDGSIHP